MDNHNRTPNASVKRPESKPLPHASVDESTVFVDNVPPPHLTSQPNLSATSIHPVSIHSHNMDDLIKLNHLTYLLYLLSFFTAGLLWIVPIVINYMRREEANGTWLATHFDWQIKTFWYSIVFSAVAIVMMIIGFGGAGIGLLTQSTQAATGSFLLLVSGGLLFAFVWIWHIYRIVRGWIALSSHQPIS